MPLQKRDEDFFKFQRTIVAQVAANAAAWGIPDGLVNTLRAARDTYEPLHFRARNMQTLTQQDAAEYRRIQQLYERDLGIFLNIHIRNNPKSRGVIDVINPAPDLPEPEMHPDADAMECRYIILPKGAKPPESPEECPMIYISKKPEFTMNFGKENIGKVFYGFCRWVNLTNPQNNGPWTHKAQRMLIT